MSEHNQQFTYQITLLRHGESTGNAQGIFQGQAEFDLSERGEAQARALAKRWLEEEITFDRIISSPSVRAKQTAEIIADSLSLSVEFNPDLKEIDNGVFAGLTHDEIAERYDFPDFMTPYEAIGESGESAWDLYLRAGRVVQELVSQPVGKFLVISHGGFLNRVLYSMLGIHPQANFAGARFHFRNAAFAIVYYDPTRHIWLLDRFNDRAHWPEDDEPLD